MSDALQTPAFVREESDGTFTVVDRENGIASPTAYASLVAALDALRSLAGFVEADPTAAGSTRTRVPLRDAKTREEVGVWRWLDASAEESEPGPDGSRVTAAGIQSMAARLNADAEPAQIDGGVIPGLGVSGVHASLKDSGTLARGWAYVGAEWIDATGRSHLALFCEVFPEVDVALDTGALAFGSIGFAWSVDNPDDQVLIQHSLTNRPAVPGLVPASAMRTATTTNGLRYARGPLTKVNIMTPDPKTSARGPSADKLAQVQASLGIPPDTKPDDLWCQMWDAVSALKQGATLEKILEGGGAPALGRAEGETDDAYAARIAKLKPEAQPGARAVGGIEGPALEDWASQMLALGQGWMGKADATAADVLAFVNENNDKVKGALAAAAPDPTAAESQVPPPAAPPPQPSAGYSRAEVIGLETRVRTVESERNQANERVAELERKQARRELQDVIVKRFADAKLTLVDASRDELVEMCVGKPEAEQKKIVDLALRAAAAPPHGTVMRARDSAADGTKSAARSQFTTHEAALDHHTKAVRSEMPDATDSAVFAEAYKRARQDFVLIDASGEVEAS